MIIFWYNCVQFLTSRYTISVLVAIESFFTLLFIQKVLNSKNKRAFGLTIASGVFNGFFVFALMSFRGSIYSSSYLLVMVLLTNIELLFLGKDTRLARLHVFAITLCDYSCLYVFSLAFLNFLFRGELSVPGSIYYSLAFVISLVATLLFAIILLKRGKKIIVMFKALTQSLSQGLLMLVYDASVCVIMLFSAFIMLPTMLTRYVSPDFTTIHSVYEMLIALLLLIVSFVVIFVQYQLEQALGHERTLLSNIQRNALLSYSFNATKDVLDKKIKFFKSELWEGDTSYFKMIRNFIKQCVHPEDQEDFYNMSSQSYPWEALASFGGNSLVTRFRVSPKEMVKVIDFPEYRVKAINAAGKEWRWSEMTCVITKEDTTGNVLVDMSFTDVDDKVTHEHKLQEAATLDTLTGILNRGAAESAIRKYLASEKNECALFIIDLDHFKEVNDILGHGKGDNLLKETATMISSLFRTSDIVGRLGGDEFIVLCKSTADKEFMTRKAKQLNEIGYRTHHTESRENLHTSMSIGIALCPQDGTDFETLYGHADAALYKSKATGRNKFFFYTSGQELKLFDFEVDGLRLGIEQIDEQHKKLVDLTNEFMQLVLSEKETDWKTHVFNTLNGMLNYAQEHFSYEEKIMAETAYAGLEHHKKRHDEFVMYAVTRFAGFETMSKDDAVELMNFLKQWLVNHILEDDKAYVKIFQKYFAKNEN